MSLSDWELWACARQQIDQHGPDAGIRAGMRADALLAAGDLQGHRTWVIIVDRIGQLTDAGEGETQH